MRITAPTFYVKNAECPLSSISNCKKLKSDVSLTCPTNALFCFETRGFIHTTVRCSFISYSYSFISCFYFSQLNFYLFCSFTSTLACFLRNCETLICFQNIFLRNNQRNQHANGLSIQMLNLKFCWIKYYLE